MKRDDDPQCHIKIFNPLFYSNPYCVSIFIFIPFCRVLTAVTYRAMYDFLFPVTEPSLMQKYPHSPRAPQLIGTSILAVTAGISVTRGPW